MQKSWAQDIRGIMESSGGHYLCLMHPNCSFLAKTVDIADSFTAGIQCNEEKKLLAEHKPLFP